MTPQQSSDTIVILRTQAVKRTGALHVGLESLRDRPDLPAAAAELIRSGTERERIFALLGLREAAHRGKEVAEPAMLALTDASPRVRTVAASTLGVIRWAGACAALEAATNDSDPDVRTHALFGLLEVDVATGVRRIEAILRDAEGGEHNALEEVLNVLEKAKPDELPSSLGALTSHPDAAIRRRAVAIIGYSASADSKPLYRGLSDSSTPVRLAAIYALTRWGHPPPADALTALFSDPDHRVWRSTLSLVVQARGPRHPASLDELPSTSPADIAEAVAVLGGPDAIPRIRAMVDQSTSEQDKLALWRAISLVGETAPEAASVSFLQPLRDTLRAGTGRVRLAALRAASFLGHAAAAVITEHLQDDAAPRARAAAVKSLSKVLGPEASPQLLHALNDPSELVRCSALEAFGRIGTGDDRVLIEKARSPASPMEKLLRWQALVRLSPPAEIALSEATRQFADPACVGRLFTRWYTPAENLRALFSRAGNVLVYSDEEPQSSPFVVMDDNRIRIGERICGFRIDRIRIHDPVTSAWGYRGELSPDPWSDLSRRVLETMSWAADR